MFLLTPHHRLMLGVLEATEYLTLSQAERLLSAAGAKGGEAYAERVLSQLAHMQKLRPDGGGVFALPSFADAPQGADALAATDVMLDVSGGKPLAVKKGTPPHKLRFLVETENGIGAYAVSVVRRGREAEANFAFGETRGEKRVLILLLENETQKEKLKIPQAHFFALPENGKIRYFQGNAAT